jgi:thiol-disulfide isomerase/thioredoxin
MRSNNRLLVLIACAAALIGVVIAILAIRYIDQPAPTSQTPATSANPLFSARFQDAQGRVQALSQWQNRIIVVNFWASWCPPCRDEMPDLAVLEKKFQERGVIMLGISTEDVATMQAFAKDAPVSYPLLAGDAEATRLAEALGNNQSVLPYTVILRRDGSVFATYFGRIHPEILEADISSLL